MVWWCKQSTASMLTIKRTILCGCLLLFAIPSKTHHTDIGPGKANFASSSSAYAPNTIKKSSAKEVNALVPVTAPDLVAEILPDAITWLLTQREADWGWRNDTAQIISALQQCYHQHTTARWTTTVQKVLPPSLEWQLSIKQLELDIVITLWRSHQTQPHPVRLARYAIALSLLCLDAHQFHQHDFIAPLQHYDVDIVRDWDFAYVTWAICFARGHVRKKQIRRLLDMADSASEHNIDTVAMTITALRCLVRDHKHRNLQHTFRKPAVNLARQQASDGGFGNVYNTALTLQALSDFTECRTHWNRTKALLYLRKHQDPDGAYTDPALTATVISALTYRGTTPRGRCNTVNQVSVPSAFAPSLGADANTDEHTKMFGSKWIDNNFGESTEMSDASTMAESPNVTITYTLWLGTNVTQNQSMSLIVPRNISFYHVMELAMEANPNNYTFEASEWPNGHYVHTLAGYKEEPMGYFYWLLYRLPDVPDPAHPPPNQLVAPVGVDDLLIEEGDNFLFWYKKL